MNSYVFMVLIIMECVANPSVRVQTVESAKVFGRTCFLGEGGSVTFDNVSQQIMHNIFFGDGFIKSIPNCSEGLGAKPDELWNAFVIKKKVNYIYSFFAFSAAAIYSFTSSSPATFRISSYRGLVSSRNFAISDSEK